VQKAIDDIYPEVEKETIKNLSYPQNVSQNAASRR